MRRKFRVDMKDSQSNPILRGLGFLEADLSIDMKVVEVRRDPHAPDRVAQVSAPHGEWKEHVSGQQEFLLITITGKIDPDEGAPAQVGFEAHFYFPHRGQIHVEDGAIGHGSFTYDGKPVAAGAAHILLNSSSD